MCKEDDTDFLHSNVVSPFLVSNQTKIRIQNMYLTLKLAPLNQYFHHITI